MDYETVIVEKVNHVASLILNRGDNMNVINQQLVRDILSWLQYTITCQCQLP